MALNRRAAVNTPQQADEGTKLVYDNLAESDHEGRLVYIADLGLQRKEYAGDYKGDYQQLSLGIEAVGQPIKDEDGKEYPRILWTKPFYIYPKGMGADGNEYLYYTKFDPLAKADTVPDWEGQLGKPVSFVVEHVQGKGDNVGKTYDNIKALNAIPAKYQDGVEANQTTPCIGDADDENNPATKALRGLVKYVFDKRVKGNEPNTSTQSAQDDFDDKPY